MLETNEWGDCLDEDPMPVSDWEAVSYAGLIREALLKKRTPEEAERDLMLYHREKDSLSAKVQSFQFDVEVREGKLWGVAECVLREPLNAAEMDALISEITGQASNGLEEGFEQRDLKTADGDIINASLWSADKT